MAKWADYLISAVHYTETNKKRYISQVQVHVDKGDTVGPANIQSRAEVLTNIDNNFTFKTIFKNNNEWKEGENVRKVKINNYFYLKTDANNTEQDNLENLPEF